MPFHITAVSQLPLSVHWRGGHRADWQGELCLPGPIPRDGRSQIPRHQADAAPAHPAPSYRHWLCLFRLSRSLILLSALFAACFLGRFPPPAALPAMFRTLRRHLTSRAPVARQRRIPHALPGNGSRCEAAMAVGPWGSVHRPESPRPGRIP